MNNENVDIKRVQDVLLSMAKKIADILEKNDIPYMIAFGTLLGAVRHKDFIPWDDDFDFYLFDDKYDEAMKVLRDNLPEDMFLENEDSEELYFHGWAHVKDIRSEAFCELFPQDSLYSHKGISVDLYRTKRMHLSELDDFLNKENREYIRRRKEKNLISDDEYEKRMLKLKENEDKAGKQVVTEDCDVYNLVPLYRCHYMKAEDVLPLKRYTFNDTTFYGPNNADNILSGIYGDYMKLPPEEKRTCHYSKVIFKD